MSETDDFTIQIFDICSTVNWLFLKITIFLNRVFYGSIVIWHHSNTKMCD